MARVDVHVRPAHYTDWQAVSTLMRVFQARHHRWHPEKFRPAIIGFTPAIFQGWLEETNELHLAAEMSGEAIGYACASRFAGHASDVTLARREVHVSLLLVAPRAQRKGVGRALLQGIEVWAGEYDAEVIGLHVHPDNATARAFYAATGYGVQSEYRAKTLRHVRRFEAAP